MATDTSYSSILYVLTTTVVTMISINIVFKSFQSLFKRDVHTSFSNLAIAFASMLSNKDSVLKRDGVKASIDGYEKLFSGARKSVGTTSNEGSISHRQSEYKTMVDSFYDLVTDFYEYGWGQSFHFAPRKQGETFEESIYRSEHFLGLKLGMDSNTKALDVGCGVGGPMRNIQQFTESDITGVTINEYQVKVGNQYCAQKGLADKCRLIQGDFQQLPKKFEKGSFDVAYAIEATCHSPDRVQTFSGVNHCLKKGGLFAGYEWVVLPERGYDASNSNHVRIKEGIEVGNGLPTLLTGKDVVKALEDSGFEVLEYYDANRNVHSKYEIPWYQTLKGSLSLKGFRMTHFGRVCTYSIVSNL